MISVHIDIIDTTIPFIYITCHIHTDKKEQQMREMEMKKKMQLNLIFL